MPNHVIKDRIWASAKLAECSKLAALAYPWIFLVADDHGRFEYHPRRIWGMAFSGRDDVTAEEVTGWLVEYHKVGLLVRYGSNLAYWTKFEGRPPTKRRASLYPAPDAAPVLDQSGTKQDQGGADPLPPAERSVAERSRAEQEQSAAANGCGAADGNGALSKQDFAREVWRLYRETTGQDRDATSIEFALMCKWHERYPLRVVCHGIAETPKRADARSLTYFGPSVEDEGKRWAKAVGQ